MCAVGVPLDRHRHRHQQTAQHTMAPRFVVMPSAATRLAQSSTHSWKQSVCGCGCGYQSAGNANTTPWGVWLVQTPSPLGLRSVLQTRQGCVSNHDDTKFTSNSVVRNDRSLPAPVKNERKIWPWPGVSMLASGMRTTADRCPTTREGCTQQSIEEPGRPRDSMPCHVCYLPLQVTICPLAHEL
jgi:hypothetical protein